MLNWLANLLFRNPIRVRFMRVAEGLIAQAENTFKDKKLLLENAHQSHIQELEEQLETDIDQAATAEVKSIVNNFLNN